MKQLLKPLCISILILAAVSPLAAQNGFNVLATNSWTAAFVDMAGGSAVYLAPAEMEHPPEYELLPSDVRKVRDADLLVYAGYEVLMKTVFDSFNKPEDTMIKIMTSYSPVILEKSVLAIAEKLGTTGEAKRNITNYKSKIAEGREALKEAGLFGSPVLVQFHQKPLAQALGFEILGVFGPQPLEVRQIAEMGRLKPAFIIDNAHSPLASPLEEILGLDAVDLINFPGYRNADGSVCPDTLTGVLDYNLNKLIRK